jgi:hypothetical protein
MDIYDVKYAIILLHGDIKKHYASRAAIKKWNNLINNRNTDGLKTMEVTAAVKQYLQHNSKNIVVTEVPCIIYCQQDRKTMIFHIDEMESILNSYYE